MHSLKTTITVTLLALTLALPALATEYIGDRFGAEIHGYRITQTEPAYILQSFPTGLDIKDFDWAPALAQFSATCREISGIGAINVRNTLNFTPDGSGLITITGDCVLAAEGLVPVVKGGAK